MTEKTLLRNLHQFALEYRDRLIIVGNPNSYEKDILFRLINNLETVADDCNLVTNLKYQAYTGTI